MITKVNLITREEYEKKFPQKCWYKKINEIPQLFLDNGEIVFHSDKLKLSSEEIWCYYKFYENELYKCMLFYETLEFEFTQVKGLTIEYSEPAIVYKYPSDTPFKIDYWEVRKNNLVHVIKDKYYITTYISDFYDVIKEKETKNDRI